MVKVQLTVWAIVRVTFALEDIYLSAVTMGFTAWERSQMDPTPIGLFCDDFSDMKKH